MSLLKFVVLIFALPLMVFSNSMNIPQQKLDELTLLGKLAGEAHYAGLDYAPFYLKLMQVERKRNWTEQQISYIGIFFSVNQGQKISELEEANTKYSKSEIKTLKKEISTKLDSLNQIKFDNKPTQHSRILCYYMGKNNTPFKSGLVYPVNDQNPTMFLRIENDTVASAEVRRVTDPVLNNNFSTELWKSNKGRDRLNIVKDLFAKHTVQGLSESEILVLLGTPEKIYTRDFGYTELK